LLAKQTLNKTGMFLLLFVLSGLMLQDKLEEHRPSGVHAWAQADRYALAAQFHERGTPVFEAYTFYMGSKNGRVGVEFPLIPWLSAQITRHTSLQVEHLPLVFRWVNWFFLLVGIWSLSITLGKQGNYKAGSLWMSILFLSSPIALFYGFGFIPDAASAGMSLLSASCLIRYLQSNHRNDAYASMLSGTLAALLKITAGIYLFAAFLVILYVETGKRFPKRNRISILLFSTAFALLVALVGAYDYYLVHKININYYAPVFMSQMNPVSGIKEWFGIIKAMKFWDTEYLTNPQYMIVSFSLLVAGLKSGSTFRQQLFNPKFIYSSLILIGLLFWSVLFGRQLPDHDYYFLSSFFPLLLIFSALAIHRLIQSSGCLSQILIPILAVWSLSIALSQFEDRQADHYRSGDFEINNHVGWLQDMNHSKELIPEDEMVFVFYEFEPNLSLVYLNRRGMVFNHEEMGRDTDHIAYWGNRLAPTHIVLRNEWIEKLKSQKPVLYAQMNLIFDTETYSIYNAPKKWILKP
jgi:hypothetical protein